MSKKKSELEQIIKTLLDSDLMVKDIYEAVGLDRMDFYNLRRSTRISKQAELAAKLKEKFAQYLQNKGAEEESQPNLSDELIQTLKRENELLRQVNEERLKRILDEIEQLKKRFPE